MLDGIEDVAQNLIRPLIGVDVGGELRAVKIEDGLGFFLVHFLAAFDHLDIDVVEPVFFERSALEAIIDLGLVRALKMENAAHVEAGTEDLGLVDITGNAIEDEEVDIGFESTGLDHGIDLIGPKPDGNIVRDELAFAGILQEGLAEIRTHVDGAKDIATSAMKKAGDGAENFALSAFAGTGGAKEKKGFIKHDFVN